jgi:TRAP-type mannitol/chloroaromatic compound transport system substrate-binding protein
MEQRMSHTTAFHFEIDPMLNAGGPGRFKTPKGSKIINPRRNIMKQKSASVGFLFVVLFVCFFSLISQSYAADKIKLSFSTIFPQTHLHTVLNQMFADEINKRTNGQVEITVYPGRNVDSACKNL